MKARAALFLAVAALAACAGAEPRSVAEYERRLERARERLARLAEAQRAADPGNDRLFLLSAGLKGPAGLAEMAEGDVPATPLMAVLGCTWLLRGVPGTRFEPPDDGEAREALDDLEAAFPGSSYTPLFEARSRLLRARRDPAFWAPLAACFEEALRRDRWGCPVRDFHLWLQDWLAKHEPDRFVRATLNPNYANLARSVILDAAHVVLGAAPAPGPPRPELSRLTAALRRLCEDRMLRGADDMDFLVAGIGLKMALHAEFLLAWRRGDLSAMRQASASFEEALKTEAAFEAYQPEYLAPYEPVTWAFMAPLRRAMGSLLEKARTGEGDPEAAIEQLRQSARDEDHLVEAARRLEAGAEAYLAALRAGLGRRGSFYSEFADRRPAVSPKTNWLARALDDRDVLLKDPLPPDRMEGFLDAVFDGDKVYGTDSEGWGAYEAVVRESLRRPGSLPPALLRARMNPRDMHTIEAVGLLRERGEEVEGWTADPAAIRDGWLGDVPHGYCVLLADVARRAPKEAVAWLPEAEGDTPQPGEIRIAETLRGATGRDFGPDWPRWRRFLETGE